MHKEQLNDHKWGNTYDSVLNINSDTLKTLTVQDTDNSLKGICKAADLHPADKGVGIFKKGLSYWQWGPTKGKDSLTIEQLVLSTQCNNTILHLTMTFH